MFWTLGMCYQVRFITRSVKCMVKMRWVMGWSGNGFGCSMKDDRMCTMRHEVGVHLWWIMIWCARSTKECVTTDVSQYLICPWLSPLPTPKEVPGRQAIWRWPERCSAKVANIAGGRILWGYTKTCAPLRKVPQ